MRRGAVLAYLRGRAHPDHLIGHNPLGASSVFAVLAILCAAGRHGPGGRRRDRRLRAAHALRFERHGAAWPPVHKAPGKWIVIALVSLHVLAVLFYVLVKRDNAGAADDRRATS